MYCPLEPKLSLAGLLLPSTKSKPMGEQAGSHGDERNFKALRVPAGLHCGADLVERCEQVAQFVAAVWRNCSAAALRAERAVGMVKREAQ